MLDNLVGKTVTGTYKRAGRPATAMALEVSAHVKMVNQFGREVPYLFGTRLDEGNAGAVVLVRADCFNPNTLEVGATKGFKAVDGLKEGEWYVTPPTADSASFAFIERITDEADRVWAATVGSQPLLNYVVGVPKPAKAKKVKAVEPEA